MAKALSQGTVLPLINNNNAHSRRPALGKLHPHQLHITLHPKS